MKNIFYIAIFGATLSFYACRADKANDANDRPPTTQAASASPENEVPVAFVKLMKEARQGEWSKLPVGEVVALVGEYFTGAPYEAGMLDEGDREQLVVTFASFDCVLLVETALAAARSIRQGNYDFKSYREHLTSMRYRNGRLDGYCSRLHYFTEWIGDNERRGLVKDVTRELGGVPLKKTLNFMSRHRESYPRFASNDSLFAGIQQMEADLQSVEIFFIPQDQIHTVYDRIQSGDIIATATDVEGLDVSHTGIAYRRDGMVGFLHASTQGGVKVSPDLQQYVQSNGIQIGVLVARPL